MELDDLKSAWHSVKDEKHFDHQEIFTMLKKKSSTTIKWLFIFTASEFSLLVFYNIYMLISGSDFLNSESIQITDNQTLFTYKLASYFSLFISLFFLLYAYRSYKKIDLNQSVKELMTSIIVFRRVVNLFILFTVASVIIFSAPFYYELGKSVYLNKHLALADGLSGMEKVYGWIAIGISVSFILIIATIYYAFVYYLFLRKLDRNLNDLKEIN